jgi:hypothetical protein
LRRRFVVVPGSRCGRGPVSPFAIFSAFSSAFAISCAAPEAMSWVQRSIAASICARAAAPTGRSSAFWNSGTALKIIPRSSNISPRARNTW